MSKMIKTMKENKASLGRNEEEIKQLAREGRLREFRDGPRLMFKADQVEQLKSEIGADGGGVGEVGSGSGTLDQVDLGVSDSGGLIGLVDTTGASGTSITLSDADHGSGIGSGVGSGSGLGSGMVERTASSAGGGAPDTGGSSG